MHETNLLQAETIPGTSTKYATVIN